MQDMIDIWADFSFQFKEQASPNPQAWNTRFLWNLELSPSAFLSSSQP